MAPHVRARSRRCCGQRSGKVLLALSMNTMAVKRIAVARIALGGQKSGCTVYTGDVGEPESAIEERCGGETSGREGIEKLGLWKRLDSHWVKGGFLLFSLWRAQIRTSLRHRQLKNFTT